MGWWGSDECYWIFGFIAPGIAVTSVSDTFGDVTSGDTRSFAPAQGVIWGPDGAAAALPDGDMGVVVQLWRRGSGDPAKVRAGVAASFEVAERILRRPGEGRYVAAALGGAGAAAQWFTGLHDDRHIGDQAFVFTRQAVEDKLQESGSPFLLSRRFTDGEGDYNLQIRVVRVARGRGCSARISPR